MNQISLFKTRLQQRGYPTRFINKHINKVKYNNRESFLHPTPKAQVTTLKPIFKCLPPPRFFQLKHIILHRYKSIKQFVNHPIFITLKYKTLQNTLVSSKLALTNENIMDIYLSCSDHISTENNTSNPPQQRTNNYMH